MTPLPDDTDEFTLRIDHQITSKQRIYGRWLKIGNQAEYPDYRPDANQSISVNQENAGLNYTYTVTPTAMFTVYAGYLRNIRIWTSPVVGTENLTHGPASEDLPLKGETR